MTKRFGFTLAEVLITLGIIGVVAAMTMPTLMNSTQGAQYKTAFKKALSALSQAVTLNMALDDWNFADIDGTTTTTDSSQNALRLFTSRMNVVKNDLVSATNDSYITSAGGFTANKTGLTEIANGARGIHFNDGITFYYNDADAKDCTDTTYTGEDTDRKNLTNRCYGVIDVNGEKGPNKYVTCDDAAANIMDSVTDERDAADQAKTCVVSNPTDIYPVYFYDQTVVPASSAAKTVLYGK